MTILGVNRRTYPREAQPGDPGATSMMGAWFHCKGCPVVVVLVAGDPDVGDYAAYCGQGAPEWVARYGDKLCFAEACVHFPGQLDAARYRGRGGTEGRE